MSDWNGYLTSTELLDVRNAMIDAGLTMPNMQDAYLQGIDPRYKGNLPGFNLPPNIRLLQQLTAMNQVHNLRNGDVPLAQWLSAAASMAESMPQADVLERSLEIVNGEAPVEPEGVETIDRLAGANLEIEPEAFIIGVDSTLSVGFLSGGVEAARSVFKILVHRHMDGEPEFNDGDEPKLISGTGWMLGPGVLITNYHVINARDKSAFNSEPDATDQDLQLQAEHTTVLFDYYGEGGPSSSVELGNGALLASDPELDFAILRIPAHAPQRQPLKHRKHPIKKRVDNALGNRVNVLQHPGGNPMRLGFRDNFVVQGDSDGLSYLTDTQVGSSGSPVFDDKWNVAALHAGSRNIQGLEISIRGRKVKKENFGIPIKRLMQRLKETHLNLHDEILAGQSA